MNPGGPWFRSLYAKLALTLAGLFAGVAVVYLFLSTTLSGERLSAGSQQLNRDLATSLTRELNLVVEGRLDPGAIKQMFHVFMMINPSIEVYLLDSNGVILSYSAHPDQVKRDRVGLEPIRRYLADQASFPLLGDDPRHPQRRKVFSVAPIPDTSNPQGYLYVVLQGEAFDSVNEQARERYLRELGLWILAGSLGLGLLMGLALFHLLTRRLQLLNASVAGFRARDSEFDPENPIASGDEIDQLKLSFDAMAHRIGEQFSALQEQDRLRRELVANVSHDLRTPLAALHGYLETLQLGGARLDASEREQFLQIALRHSQRLGRLVDDLFELSKLDARDIEPVREPFSMAELAQDVVQKFALRAQQGGIALDFAGVTDQSFVVGDIALIERALDNLVDNALAHTPRGGKVILRLQRQQSAMRISVEDSGSGIPEQDLQSVFQRFYQVDNPQRSGAHAGLGLAITKRILELHGEPIRAISQQNEGTQFIFQIPLAG